MVAIHLEAQLQWVMRKNDSGCTTVCFTSHGDVSGYVSTLLMANVGVLSSYAVLGYFLAWLGIAENEFDMQELLAICHISETINSPCVFD